MLQIYLDEPKISLLKKNLIIQAIDNAANMRRIKHTIVFIIHYVCLKHIDAEFLDRNFMFLHSLRSLPALGNSCNHFCFEH